MGAGAGLLRNGAAAGTAGTAPRRGGSKPFSASEASSAQAAGAESVRSSAERSESTRSGGEAISRVRRGERESPRGAALSAEAAQFPEKSHHERPVRHLRLSEPTGDKLQVLKFLGRERLCVGRVVLVHHRAPWTSAARRQPRTRGSVAGGRDSRRAGANDALGGGPRRQCCRSVRAKRARLRGGPVLRRLEGRLELLGGLDDEREAGVLRILAAP